MSHEVKMKLSDDLEAQINQILSPNVHTKPLVVLPFHDEKYLHESRLIYVLLPFMVEGGSSVTIQHQQIQEMEKLGYLFVSVDADSEGMNFTFHKEPKHKNNFTTI